MRVYTESVQNAKKGGGFYVVGMLDGSPLPKEQRYLIDLANKKMSIKNATPNK